MKTKKHLTLIALFLTFYTIVVGQSKTSEIVKSYYSYLDEGGTNIKSVVSADFKLTVPFAPEPLNLSACGILFKGYKTAFPDMQHILKDVFGNDQKIAVSGVFKGTNSGPLQGNPATGQKVVLPFNTIFELDAQHKIKSANVQFDNLSFMNQLKPAMASAEEMKHIIMTAYESLSKNDYATFRNLCTPDFIEYTAGGTEPIHGLEPTIESYKTFFTMAPDLKFDIKNITLDGNRAIVEVSAAGTNTGTVLGMFPPTGKRFQTNDVDIVTFDTKGKATSHTTIDPGSMLRQIGYASLTNPNTALVLNIYDKFAKGDAAGIAAACAHDVVFDKSDNPFVKNSSVIKNNKDIPGFFAELMSSGEVTKFEPIKFLADGDDVLSIIETGFKSNADGKVRLSTFAHRFTFKDGKVIAFKEITTTPQEMKSMMTGK